jgi:hypothetical protein
MLSSTAKVKDIPLESFRAREGWCGEAIAAYLNQQERIKVSSGSVYEILKESSLITRTYKHRGQRTYIGFQRTHPDSL